MPTRAQRMSRPTMPTLPYPVPRDAVQSAGMKAVPKTDTRPEVALRSALHRLGISFRKEYKVQVEGRKRTVDIAVPALGLAIFVDGCFWHGCPEHGTVPKRNRGYWA